MADRYLVTAALPYSNGPLHVGHIAGAYLPCDIFVRYLRLRGAEVRAVCGSDDHGVAIMLTAQKEGKTPQQVAQYYNERHRKALSGLGIDFDIYSSTSGNPFHYKTSQDFFLKIYEKGFFQKKETSQFFDPVKNIFLPDRYVKGTCGHCGAAEQNGDQCEQCGAMLDADTLKNPVSAFSGAAVSAKPTAHWFLDLSKFNEQVEQWLATADLRDHTRAYVKGLLSTGLISRSMTRDTSWGIPVPLEDPEAKNKVLYVWFDAPIGYISNTKELCAQRDGDAERYADWWKSPDTKIVHFIGEDNTIFHCLIWIAMLSAEGTFRLPQSVVVNCFLNIKFPGQEEEKMSKSRGTAVWIEDILESGESPDVLRYYLTSVAPEQARTAYRPDEMLARANGELPNVLGNLVNRVVQFTLKHIGPTVPEYPAGRVTERDQKLFADMERTHKEVGDLLEGHSFRAAMERSMEFARECNRYLDEKAPWSTRKTDMELTCVTLAYALSAIKCIGVLLNPFMPGISAKLLAMLSQKPAPGLWQTACQPLASGTPLGTPEILFPKRA